AADCALGAVLLRARRARLHETHLDPQARPRATGRARPRGDRARPRRRPRGARALRRHSSQPAMSQGSRCRLVAVTLDEASTGRSTPDIEHERAVAIYDLIEQNLFAPIGHDGGPYALHLSIAENRLAFDVRLADGAPVVVHMLSLTPFRRIVKDYFLICDNYYRAIRTATPSQIEAIDMGRRA